jgi:hypothetical protein
LKLLSFRYQAASTKQDLGMDDGTIEDRASHADYGPVFYGATMDGDAVTYGDIITDDHWVARWGGAVGVRDVDDGSVLNVGTCTDTNEVIITA